MSSYIPGDPWMMCDQCCGKYRRSVMRKRWDGLMVCPMDFELEPPQNHNRYRFKDKQSFPDSRPRNTYDLAVNEVKAEDL